MLLYLSPSAASVDEAALLAPRAAWCMPTPPAQPPRPAAVPVAAHACGSAWSVLHLDRLLALRHALLRDTLHELLQGLRVATATPA